MKLSKTDLLALVRKYLNGKANEQETSFLNSYYQYFEQEDDGLASLSDAEKEQLEATMRMRILAEVRREAPVRTLYKWGWAAAVLLLIGAGIYFWPKQNNAVQQAQTMKPEAAPGKNGAILTLADGSQVTLDSLGNGVVASQNGVQAVLQNGRLSYQSSSQNPDVIAFNTMSTPRGRQFHVQLPDGTDVWLNAASSIRYPTRFTGKERKVQITGEAYFEVAKNAAAPFFVEAGSMQVEVLGTNFNMNTYTNETRLRTTLLEGSVRVRQGTAAAMLHPGEQAEVDPQGNAPVVQQVDTDKVMAWKNGVFNFDKADLKTVMREIERWYDVDVVYEKNIPDIKFGGEMSRNTALSGVLRVLEDAGVHFRMEAGRRLIVMP